jgi:hypothetical protein
MPIRAALLLALLISLPARAAAQAVRGTVVDGAGSPVPGALVALVGEDGRVAGEVLADGGGRFLVRATVPGRFTLRARRVGYRTSSSPALTLAAGETADYRMVAAVERVTLPALTATSERRCTSATDPGVVTLWEEARKALDATAVTSRQYPYRYTMRRGLRHVDAGTLLTRSEETHTDDALLSTPFVAVPAEQLATRGYIEEAGDTTVFFAPDAQVLLSQSFLELHCFTAKAGDVWHRGMVGLGFAPVCRTGRRADVEGVLWMDARTAELRVLEYGYTGIPAVQMPREVGGRVEFRRLPEGGWIVSRWRIRMPDAPRVVRSGVPSARAAGLSMSVPGLAEETGEVLAIRDRAGAAVPLEGAARLAGLVYDSTRGAPLAGARVYLAGTQSFTVTDSAGRYVLDGVAEGVYSLGYAHPRLDSLRYSPQPVQVVVTPPLAMARDLAIPSLARLLTAACPAAAPAAETGAFAGLVTAQGDGRPMAGVPVRAAWQRPGEAGDSAHLISVTDEAGAYRFCAVPERQAVMVAAFLPGAPAPHEVRLEPGVPARLDLALAPAPGFTTGSASAERAHVKLHLVDAATARPIVGAVVRFGPMPVTLTDAEGLVQLADVPGGSYGVEFLHEVYGAGTSRVIVRGSGEVSLELRVPRRTVMLDPIAVEATRVMPGQFDTRRRARRLDIITRDEIVSRHTVARHVGDLVLRFPSIRMRQGFGKVCLETDHGRRASDGEDPNVCHPVQLIMDDVMIDQGYAEELLASIPVDDLESLIFIKPTEAMATYGERGRRGVLLIYTFGNGPSAQRRH